MSSEQLAIQVKDLSKHYFIYQRPEDRLKQYLLPRLHRLFGKVPRKYYREFKALDNISFEVKRGEAVGIIGRNGAGKSTLLQLICGTLTPTSGTVEVNGRVAALLELGSGFNPDFTGRENVYLNASVLGLTREETDAKFDEIAAFADIGDYIDQSTKTYSTGMLMRLAFAVNTCVDPDILIVDEALSVGDAPFQSKCFKRLRNLIEKGTTILFVSHDIATVRSICSRALWLKQGVAEAWGNAMDVAKLYEKYCWAEQGVIMETNLFPNTTPSDLKFQSLPAENQTNINTRTAFDYPPIILDNNPVFEKARLVSRHGTGDVIIKNFLMLNDDNEVIQSCDYNQNVRLLYLIEAAHQVSSDIVVGFRVRDLQGGFVYSANDIYSIHKIEAVAGDRFIISTSLRMPLTHQDYVVLTGVFGFKNGSSFLNGTYDFTNSVIWDVIDEAAFFKVRQFDLMPLAGPVHISTKMVMQKIN